MSLICFTSALPWASGPKWLLGFGKSVFCTLGFVMGEEELAIKSRKAGNHSWVLCTTKPTHRGSFTARLCHPHLGFQHTSSLIFQCLQIAAMPDKCYHMQKCGVEVTAPSWYCCREALISCMTSGISLNLYPSSLVCKWDLIPFYTCHLKL